MNKVLVYDTTAYDSLSKVRGIGRYLQILRENFPGWTFTNYIENYKLKIENSVFINPFFNFLSSPLIIRRKFPKQIAVIHDLIPLKHPEHFPIGLKGNAAVFLNKMAISNYDIVITDSVQSKNDIVTILHIPENKIKVVYPCLPKIYNSESIIQNSKKHILNSKFNSEFLTLNSKFLLYVGDATWNKNLVNLAKAIKMQELPCVFVGKVFSNVNGLRGSRINELENKVSKVDNFFRVGNTDQRSGRTPTGVKKLSTSDLQNPWNKEFNEFVQLAKDDKRFVFSGYISDEELIHLYQKALCNILVSRDEGFGFSYLEASSQQCPSILSNIPVLREISDNNALFINPEDSISIVKAIASLKSDNTLRSNLIKQSHERSSFFSSRQFKNAFLSLLP